MGELLLLPMVSLGMKFRIFCYLIIKFNYFSDKLELFIQKKIAS